MLIGQTESTLDLIKQSLLSETPNNTPLAISTKRNSNEGTFFLNVLNLRTLAEFGNASNTEGR